MATTEHVVEPVEQPVDKGLKSGALGLISTTIIATASVAPAYSIAATLVFVVGAVALQSPAVAVLAFVPMLLTSIGYSELNKADPDCGTTFTWATRAFGPKTGWAGGWGIVAADILVMASLAQVAGQYGFLLFNAKGIGSNPGSGWVLLVGVLWIVVMTYICYRGIEVSANFQKVLLGIELVMLLVLSITALVKVGNGTAPPGHLTPSFSWLNPFQIAVVQRVRQRHHPHGVHLLGLGHGGLGQRGDQGQEQDPGPGRDPVHVHPAGHLRAGDLLDPVVRRHQDHRQRPGQHQQRRRRAVGAGQPGVRHVRLRLVPHPPAAADGAVLGRRLHPDHDPADRADHAVDGGVQGDPASFSKIHPRYLTPTVSTIVMGAISIIVYVVFNYTSNGIGVIGDAVIAIGLYIAFYYGLTGFACAWYYRRNLTSSARNLWMQGILPVAGGLMLWFLGGWSLWLDYDVATANDFTMWTVPWIHWQIGGAFVISVVAALVGLVCFLYCRFTAPAFFKKQTLTRATETLVPDPDA